MHSEQIKKWNDKINPEDLVYHLGDFFLTTKFEQIDFVLGSLNGKIRLIKGNHDKSWVKKTHRLKFKDKFEWIKDYHEENFFVEKEKIKVVMMHYPMRSWNKSHFGSYHLAGHTHGSMEKENLNFRRMDVGVDVHSGYPINFDYIHSILSKRPFNNHHGD